MDQSLSSPLPAGQLGRAFTEQSDLVPLFLLRYDRDNTRRAYHRDLINFFESDVVTLEMAREVTFPHVNAFIARLETDGKSPATIRRHSVTLRTFFAWLVALQLLPHNPADRNLVRRIAPERPQDKVFTVLTRDQAATMLASIDLSSDTGPRDHALISTLLHCVLRRSEAAAMDFEHLRQSGPYSVLVLPRAKGGANQTVKVPEHVADEIESIKNRYGFRTGPIWRSLSRNASRGRRLSGSSIYNIARKAAVSAGITDNVGAHTMRHTGCTLAIEGGATIQQVQVHARHKNIETTMMYLHQRDRLADSAADFIDI